MAAVFDSKAAEKRGQQIGDGTPIHITTPLRTPWVPLRILGLGKAPNELIDADVYLLTDRAPKLLPRAGRGYTVERQVPASTQLLRDLRSDKGMGWMPASGMTLTHLVIGSTAPELRYDLAISVGRGAPSREAAGLAPLPTPVPLLFPSSAGGRSEGATAHRLRRTVAFDSAVIQARPRRAVRSIDRRVRVWESPGEIRPRQGVRPDASLFCSPTSRGARARGRRRPSR
jgi:hypothetical protein